MVQPAIASSTLDKLQASARQKNLAQSNAWHRLLHYRRNLLGRYRSEIDDPAFFLSPAGRHDPSSELEATLAAFFRTATDDSQPSPQCRFPARYAYLKEQLKSDVDKLPQKKCLRFEKWKAQMNPESVSLVFASAYMNNPASMYGHTFLRFNAKEHSSEERLLDYVVNFAADLESDNGFLFAVKGLLGGYHGRFSTFPYYMKVQEYNNLESRDLWEYDLRVPAANLERLLQHLWELGPIGQPYFFLNKNCSYYLLPVLDVMDPTLQTQRRFVFKAIPVDTIRAVIETPRILKQVSCRPSHASKMVARRKKLSIQEIHLAERLVKDPGPVTSAELSRFAPRRQAMILDSAYDLFRYQVGFNRDQPEPVQEKEQQLHLLRNALRISGDPLSPSPDLASGEGWDEGKGRALTLALSHPSDGRGEKPVAPNLGHKTGRLGFSYGFSNRSHFEELSLRPAVHDQDDPSAGYLPASQLEMFHLKLRFDNDRQTLYLQQMSLVDLVSITPWDRWIHPPSWKVRTGLYAANDQDRDPENALYYGLNLGAGFASPFLWQERILFYGMAETNLELGHAYNHSVRFGGGPCAGVLFPLSKVWRAHFQASQTEYATGGTPATTTLGLYQSLGITRNGELRVKLERQNSYKEVLFSWVWFL